MNNQIRTVVLGYGFSGSTFFAPFLDLHPGYELVGALERHTKKIQKDYPYTKSYNTLEDVLVDENVDLVVVNTPIGTHYELAKKVLESGKNTIVEKTFTNTVAQAKELWELAKAKDLHLFVYQNRRFDSDFLTYKKVLESGKLGKVVEASISYDFYLPTIRGDVHTEQADSGGEFNNRGSHVTDQAIFLFGLPDAVFADFAAFRPDSPVEDYFQVTLFYTDKRVKLRATDISVNNEYGYIAHGLKGSFLKNRSDMQEERILAGAKPKSTHWCEEPENQEGVLTYLKEGKKIQEIIPTEDGNYYNYFEAIFQTMTNGAPSPVSGEDGYKTMLVMDAARKSVEEKRIISLKEEL